MELSVCIVLLSIHLVCQRKSGKCRQICDFCHKINYIIYQHPPRSWRHNASLYDINPSIKRVAFFLSVIFFTHPAKRNNRQLAVSGTMTKVAKTKRGTKGNDGKARRKKLYQQIIVALSSTASFLVVLHFIGILPRNGYSNVGLRVGRQARLEALRKIGQQKKSVASQGHREGGRKHGLLPMREALMDPNYDPVARELAQQILAADTNLIDIESQPHLIKDDSYHGIVAVFCPLNFAAQKAKPPGENVFIFILCYFQNHPFFN